MLGRKRSGLVVRLVMILAVGLVAAGCGSEAAQAGAEAPAAESTVPATSLVSPSVEPTPTATADATSPAVSPTEVPTVEATPAPTAIEPPVAETTRTRISYGSEVDQFAWLQIPDGPAPDDGFPTVVLIHGGFWRQQFGESLMDGLADDLAGRGYATWNIEYARVGGAGGWPATGDDVLAAIEHLAVVAATEPIDLERVVSVGHSAGGHLGLWALGQENQVKLRGSVGLGAVVDLAYFREAQALLGGTIDQVPQVYECAAPVLDPDRVVLIQGSADRIVPRASLAAAEDASVPIVDIEGDDHFDLIDPTSDSWAAAVAAIQTFVNRLG